MTPEMLALNPVHKIPTLQVGKEGFGESHAILRYLASSYKPETYPTDLLHRAKVDSMLDMTSNTLYPLVGPNLGYKHMGFANPDDAAMGTARDTLENDVLPLVNATLEGKKYLTGDTPTIADYSFVVTMALAVPDDELAGRIKGKFANIERYMKECAELPGLNPQEDGSPMQIMFGFAASKAPSGFEGVMARYV